MLLHPPRSVDPVRAEPSAATGGPGPPPARGHLDDRPHGARRWSRRPRGPGRRAVPGPVPAAGPGLRGRPRPARRHVVAGRGPRGHPGAAAGLGAMALPAAERRPPGRRRGPDRARPAGDAGPGRVRPHLQPGRGPGGAAGPGGPGRHGPGPAARRQRAGAGRLHRGRPPGPAVVLLPTAEVVQVLQDPAGLTATGQERGVQLRMPSDRAPIVAAAIATARIFVVKSPGLAAEEPSVAPTPGGVQEPPPEPSEPGLSDPDASVPDLSEPATSEPGASGPGTSEPDAPQSGASQPGGSLRDGGPPAPTSPYTPGGTRPTAARAPSESGR
jgi:hypothetical protein